MSGANARMPGSPGGFRAHIRVFFAINLYYSIKICPDSFILNVKCRNRTYFAGRLISRPARQGAQCYLCVTVRSSSVTKYSAAEHSTIAAPALVLR